MTDTQRRNSASFESLAKRRQRRARNRRRQRTYAEADRREIAEDLGDQAYAIVSAQFASMN